MLTSLQFQAQNTKPLIQSKLDGTVIDDITNQPIIGASINIKGTTHGVVTDAEGKFYFQTGQKLPYTLIVTYIGYKIRNNCRQKSRNYSFKRGTTRTGRTRSCWVRNSKKKRYYGFCSFCTKSKSISSNLICR